MVIFNSYVKLPEGRSLMTWIVARMRVLYILFHLISQPEIHPQGMLEKAWRFVILLADCGHSSRLFGDGQFITCWPVGVPWNDWKSTSSSTVNSDVQCVGFTIWMMNCFGALKANKNDILHLVPWQYQKVSQQIFCPCRNSHSFGSENGLPQETHSIPLHAHYLVACIPILLKSIFLNLSMSFYIPLHDFRSEISIIPIFLLKNPPNFVG